MLYKIILHDYYKIKNPVELISDNQMFLKLLEDAHKILLTTCNNEIYFLISRIIYKYETRELLINFIPDINLLYLDVDELKSLFMNIFIKLLIEDLKININDYEFLKNGCYPCLKDL
jgi:uncharacterized protein Smg (DUF494 family)